jgi:hypothetical protein
LLPVSPVPRRQRCNLQTDAAALYAYGDILRTHTFGINAQQVAMRVTGLFDANPLPMIDTLPVSIRLLRQVEVAITAVLRNVVSLRLLPRKHAGRAYQQRQ